MFVGILGTSAVTAATIHVPADQPTIQAGIGAAANGDTVLVAPGEYYETIDFLGKAITVASSDGPAVTVIIRGARFGNGETRSSVLSGFTLLKGAVAFYDESAVVILGASPTVAGNAILSTGGGPGGGACCQLYPVGVFVLGGSPLVTGNVIDGWNQAVSVGSSSSEIIGNTISSNFYSGVWGSADSSLIRSNAFVVNLGTGVDVRDSPVSIIQNLIVRNSAAISWSGTPPRSIIANTISQVFYGWGFIFGDFAAPLIMENNLIIGETGGRIPSVQCERYDGSTPPIIGANDVYGSSTGAWGTTCGNHTGIDGNISADPSFADASNGDFHLTAGSAAIDAGFNEAPGLPAVDADGEPRVSNGVVDIGMDEYSTGPLVSLTPSSVDFGDQPLTTTNTPRPLTLHNGSSSSIAIRLIGTGFFFGQTNSCGGVLAAGASCEIDVSFRPDYPITYTGVLTVMTDASESPLVVFLSGHGTSPELEFSRPILAPTVIGGEAQGTATLSNQGNQDLLIYGMDVASGTDFTLVSTDCPMSPTPVAPHGKCTLTWSFQPTAPGLRWGSVTFRDNELGSPHTFGIPGLGLSKGIVSFSVEAVVFGDQIVGRTSAPKTVTLTNTGTGPLGLGAISSDDEQYSTNFSQTNDCPSVLAVGEHCSIQISFSPTFVGQTVGALKVTNDSTPDLVWLFLYGTGVAGVPTLTTLVPESLLLGSPDTPLDVYGSGFVWGAVVKWNGSSLPTQFFSEGQVRATVPGAFLQSVGTASINVLNPAPGGLSAGAPLTIYRPRGYLFTSAPYSYRHFTGTNLQGGYEPTRIESPFPLHLGGGVYTSLFPFVKGAVTSGMSPFQPAESALGIAPFDMLLLAAGWGSDRSIFWQVLGSAPARELVVEWRNVGPSLTFDPSITVTFQVVFFEDKSDVLFNYADVTFGGAYASDDSGAAATVGIQVGPGQATIFSQNTPSLSDASAILWTLAPDGDANGDGKVDVHDVFYLLNALFAGGPLPVGLSDVNGDGVVDVRDIFYLINYLFAGGPAPM